MDFERNVLMYFHPMVAYSNPNASSTTFMFHNKNI